MRSILASAWRALCRSWQPGRYSTRPSEDLYTPSSMRSMYVVRTRTHACALCVWTHTVSLQCLFMPCACVSTVRTDPVGGSGFSLQGTVLLCVRARVRRRGRGGGGSLQKHTSSLQRTSSYGLFRFGQDDRPGRPCGPCPFCCLGAERILASSFEVARRGP